MGPGRSPRANIDQDRTSRGKDSRWAERDRIAPVWKCDRPLNVEPRTAMLIPARVSQGVTSVYLRIGLRPDLTNTDRPPSRNEKISHIVRDILKLCVKYCTKFRNISDSRVMREKCDLVRFLHPDLHARAHSLLQARRISSTDQIRRDGFTSRGMETRVTATSGN